MNTETHYAGASHDDEHANAAASPGMFGWYRHTSASEKRAFWSCKIGYALDAMDTQFLSFAIPALTNPGCPPPLDNLLTQTRVGGGTSTDCALRDPGSVTAFLDGAPVELEDDIARAQARGPGV